MAELTAIPTLYKGIRFRSRLEAKWAVWMDCVGWKWEYEPGAYQLSNGEYYTPDFFIYTARKRDGKRIVIPAEVKPSSDPGDSCWDKFKLFMESLGYMDNGSHVDIDESRTAGKRDGLMLGKDVPNRLSGNYIWCNDDFPPATWPGWEEPNFRGCASTGYLSYSHPTGDYGCRMCGAAESHCEGRWARVTQFIRHTAYQYHAEAINKTQWRAEK